MRTGTAATLTVAVPSRGSLIPKTGTLLIHTPTDLAVWELVPQKLLPKARRRITTVEPGGLVATCPTGNHFLGQG